MNEFEITQQKLNALYKKRRKAISELSKKFDPEMHALQDKLYKMHGIYSVRAAARFNSEEHRFKGLSSVAYATDSDVEVDTDIGEARILIDHPETRHPYDAIYVYYKLEDLS